MSGKRVFSVLLTMFLVAASSEEVFSQCRGGRGGSGAATSMSSGPTGSPLVMSNLLQSPAMQQQMAYQRQQMLTMQQRMFQQQQQLASMRMQQMRQLAQQQQERQQDIQAQRLARAEARRTERAEKLAARVAKRKAEQGMLSENTMLVSKLEEL